MAEWIWHSDSNKMIKSVDIEERLKCLINTSGQNKEMTFLTEQGLYDVTNY